MKRFAILLAAVVAGVALVAAFGADYRMGGIRALITYWEPEVYPPSQRVTIPVDTAAANASFQDLAFVRASKPLTLVTTPIEDERILHPSVVYIPEGFGGATKYNWWMVATPFPATDSTDYENPEVYSSADGDSWTAITSNPIDPDPGGSNFNHDPELFYRSNGDGTGTLYCFYL